MHFILLLVQLFVLPIRPTELPRSKHKIIVIAHRGNHENAPENTIAAYKNAINIGVDYIEIDLRTSKDSQLVVMHDATLDRMTDSKGVLSQFTLDSLQLIPVYNKAHPEFGLHKIPLFEEVLVECKGKVNIYLDFKNASVKQTYELLHHYNMERQVVVYVNSMNQLVEWKKLAPQIPIMVSLPKNIIDITSLESFIRQFDFEILDGDFQQYSKEMVLKAKDLNRPVWADIQSSNEGFEKWNMAIELGLKALQTDHPSRLIQYLKDRNFR